MKFTIANALTIIDKYKVENAKKMGMTVNNLCNSCTNVESIPKAEYEARLKADLRAMLTEILTDFDNLIEPNSTRIDCESIIEQKINELKGRK